MMGVVVGIILIICGLIVIGCFIIQMKSRNTAEYDMVNDLKKRIDELENDNVDVAPENKKAKIIVPDIVDADESTNVSTQKEECKVYEVAPNEKIEKVVVGSNEEKEDVFINNEIERVEDEEFEVIKENKSFVSKLLNNKKDEE